MNKNEYGIIENIMIILSMDKSNKEAEDSKLISVEKEENNKYVLTVKNGDKYLAYDIIIQEKTVIVNLSTYLINSEEIKNRYIISFVGSKELPKTFSRILLAKDDQVIGETIVIAKDKNFFEPFAKIIKNITYDNSYQINKLPRK